ncbi:MAG: 30S ribosomal protein S6 [Candidatus Hydrogenedentota bacterium]|nr:MAG: 30S ribosomal protein S6 [Candidatus Hydrogenedentota bacterium]
MSESEKTREYELIVVLDESDQELLKQAKENTEAAIKKRNANIKTSEDWGSRKLFHEVRHIGKGHFYFYVFEAAGDAISKINQDLQMNTHILKTFLKRIS